MNTSSRLPSDVIPILKVVSESNLTPAGCPLEVWRCSQEDARPDVLMELGIALFNSELRLSSLPIGYSLVAYIFDWEAQCQFDGWHALESRAAVLDQIVESFEYVGLPNEARAIARASQAWMRAESAQKAASSAYGELPSEYPVDEDRFRYLSSYFSKNACQLFYLNE